MHSFEWSESSGGCCGVVELQGFDENMQAWGEKECSEIGFVVSKTKKELWAEVFKVMMRKRHSHDGGRGAYAHIWFVKPRGCRRFECSGLMKLFSENKDVWHLGTYKNPNTGNTIRGFSFVMKNE